MLENNDYGDESVYTASYHWFTYGYRKLTE